MPMLFRRRSGVGVVEIFGTIGGGARVQEQSRILDSLRKDKRFKAVIVEIDSPGGTASGSELLYNSLMRVAQEKPVVAYIRGTGASGAYYISCAANKIVALPSSLVGSIGVIYLRPVLQQLLQKLGVSFSVYKSGEFKDMTGFWRSPTSDEEGKFKELIDEIYGNFVRSVATGRQMDEEKVREFATGEIFTGRGARERGLVDELGDFDRALDLAADLGRTRRRPVWIRRRRPMMERFMGRVGGPGAVEGITSELERVLMGGLYYMAMPYLSEGLQENNQV